MPPKKKVVPKKKKAAPAKKRTARQPRKSLAQRRLEERREQARRATEDIIARKQLEEHLWSKRNAATAQPQHFGYSVPAYVPYVPKAAPRMIPTVTSEDIQRLPIFAGKPSPRAVPQLAPAPAIVFPNVPMHKPIIARTPSAALDRPAPSQFMRERAQFSPLRSYPPRHDLLAINAAALKKAAAIPGSEFVPSKSPIRASPKSPVPADLTFADLPAEMQAKVFEHARPAPIQAWFRLALSVYKFYLERLTGTNLDGEEPEEIWKEVPYEIVIDSPSQWVIGYNNEAIYVEKGRVFDRIIKGATSPDEAKRAWIAFYKFMIRNKNPN